MNTKTKRRTALRNAVKRLRASLRKAGQLVQQCHLAPRTEFIVLSVLAGRRDSPQEGDPPIAEIASVIRTMAYNHMKREREESNVKSSSNFRFHGPSLVGLIEAIGQAESDGGVIDEQRFDELQPQVLQALGEIRDLLKDMVDDRQ